MKHVRFVGLLLVAVFAVSALLSTSAFALPEFLPITSPNNTYKGHLVSAEGILENSAGTKVKCTAAPGEGGFETDTLGTFHIKFENCTAEGFKCKTGADGKEGVILSEGSFHFVYDTLGTGETLGVAILFLPKLTEFECLGGLAKNTVKGTLLCLIKSPLTSAVSHTFKCEGTAKGIANEKTYYDDNGTKVSVLLLSSLNSGEFKESNEQAEGTVETINAGAFMTE